MFIGETYLPKKKHRIKFHKFETLERTNYNEKLEMHQMNKRSDTQN